MQTRREDIAEMDQKGEGNETERRTGGTAAPLADTRKTSKSDQHQALMRACEQASDQGEDTDSRASAHFSVHFAASSRMASIPQMSTFRIRTMKSIMSGTQPCVSSAQ